MSELEKVANPFDEWDERFAPLNALNSPAELQGMLCGRLCGVALNEADWLRLVSDFMALTEEPDQATTSALLEFLTQTRSQLAGEGFSFVLLLPDDEQGMAERVEALSQWCHGFLSGFGASGAAGQDELAREIADTLEDFSAIVQVAADDNDAASTEADFIEVAEYVRMSALTIFQHYHPQAVESDSASRDEASNTLH
ncbi:UPF0149 family protein [Gilvimarinus sp. SDUM040013]|uniref:UPF0149 family protein n=1 Tax=Gilvimarinus gilvus TaxID=3058038 RepID=A0ABU4RZY5_9GAMM|nr:UPF0149 family protein [Gilvimarinus sp. SDUM040013]MDO3388569.1 UPF0149 family protein [Gilvimarinus sp. SDUM040013]MDX6848559.1 UPF0149 family protein [Gilvimarinus sp. SDUM040013]